MKISQILYFSTLALLACSGSSAQGTTPLTTRPNLAIVATPSGPTRGGGFGLNNLNDGLAPTNTGNFRGGGGGGNRTQARSMYWVQYEWKQPVTTKEIAVYWWNYNNNIRLPEQYRISYWDGNAFVPVKNPTGLGLENNQLNATKFDPVTTTRLRIDLDSADRASATLLEWIVYQAENSPNHPPIVVAGVDRDVMMGGKTYLSGNVRSVTPVNKLEWTSVSGPGKVQFNNQNTNEATAVFTAPGTYVLSLNATEGQQKAASTLKVTVHQPPKEKRLDVVYTRPYKIDSKLWNDRIKAMIVNWIPHCIEQNERTDISAKDGGGEGGIDNFIEAGKALRGEPHAQHKGYVFSNAWVHQTVESMCIALMVDPQGDKEMIAAQAKMKQTLEKWIPIILAAQEPDGYLHTAFTLA